MKRMTSRLIDASMTILLGLHANAQPTNPGEVLAWGNSVGPVPAQLTDAVAVAAGGLHSVALKANGTVVAWGWRWNGTTNPPPGLNNVVAIAAGNQHSLALKADGTVVAWGMYDNGLAGLAPMTVPAGLAGVVAVAAGYFHCLAQKADGTVTGWGGNPDGQCNIPMNATNVIAVAAGASHSLALKADGTVTGWGFNKYGQCDIPPNAAGVVAIAAGNWHSIALKADGTVVAWGAYHSGGNDLPMTVPSGLSNVIAIAAGHYHCLALKTDGTVTGWGGNAYGECDSPVNATNVVAISAGGGGNYSYSLAISASAPVGTPITFADGQLVLGRVVKRGAVQISLQTGFSNGTIVYSLNGSDPRSNSTLFSGPFTLHSSVLLRAVAYNSDFSASAEMNPLNITILPTLSVISAGGGTVKIDPPSGPYFANSIAKIIAQPGPGYTFLQWLGDASGTSPTNTVTVNRDKYVEAVFGTAVGTTAVGGGSVSADPSVPLYPFGTTIRFTAQPGIGNYFAQWGAAGSGTNNPLVLVVSNANPSIAAVFSTLAGGKFALTLIENGRGHVLHSPPANTYDSGQPVTLTATPDAGQDFIGWTGAASGSLNPLIVTMNSNKVITANFTKRPTLRVGTPLEGMVEDGFRLTVLGVFGGQYQMMATTNLLDWTEVGTVTNTYGTSQFTDPAATNVPFGFYRAVEY